MKKKFHNFKNIKKKNKLFFFFVILLFSFMMIAPIYTSSASFRYSEFNWDEFLKSHQGYWDGYCKENETEGDFEECQDEIIKAQKKFYIKLYKMLAKYERKGLYINDNIILETIFYEMTPSSFSDDAEEYKENWETMNGAYVIDETEGEDPDIEVKYEQSYAEYFANERDTLKTLLQNMIASTTNCYGIYGDPTAHEQEDGSVYYTCDHGGYIQTVPVGRLSMKNKCVDKLSNNELGFFKYFVSKWAHDQTLLFNSNVAFFGIKHIDEHYDSCIAQGNEFPEKTSYVYNDDEHVSVDRYFDFLSYNRYFDNKAHLQEHFKESVLDPAGVDCMTSSVCSNSLEAAGKYTEYEGEIIEVRREIIYDIIEILNDYGIELSYSGYESSGYIEANGEAAVRKSFFWPIGSDETEVRNGVTYADKDPASTEIISSYGPRTNPITKKEEMHYGIDIKGTTGKTNVVAVAQGEVISVVNSCSPGVYDCNEGLGNAIILSHSNGDYTVYAQLASIDAAVNVGASLQQGQVIGTVGNTGATLESALHFELRVGGNDISYAIDPLSILNGSNPRPAGSQGDFSVHTTTLTKEEFVSRMRSYCNQNNCSSTMQNVFVAQAGEVYDASIAFNVNPELVVVRAMVEGFSPGGGTNNYWGISCYNGAGVGACSRYGSLREGIAGFANVGVVKNSSTASQMMSKYAYIGKYWYNPGSWSLGGCKYYPSIQEFLSPSRASEVANICAGPSCDKNGGGSCTKTTDEDQSAYATWQVNKKMAPTRYNIFGL